MPATGKDKAMQNLRRKKPKTLSGIETAINLTGAKFLPTAPCRKKPKTLSGIETEYFGADEDYDKSRKKPKTLSGIETVAKDICTAVEIRAGKNLKPYQGLKRSLQ